MNPHVVEQTIATLECHAAHEPTEMVTVYAAWLFLVSHIVRKLQSTCKDLEQQCSQQYAAGYEQGYKDALRT